MTKDGYEAAQESPHADEPKEACRRGLVKWCCQKGSPDVSLPLGTLEHLSCARGLLGLALDTTLATPFFEVGAKLHALRFKVRGLNAAFWGWGFETLSVEVWRRASVLGRSVGMFRLNLEGGAEGPGGEQNRRNLA